MSNEINIQGVKIHNLDYDEFMKEFLKYLKGGQKRTIAFINAHCINVTRKDKEYKDIINGFDLILADGIGVFLASLANKNTIRENLNGTDLMPKIFRDVNLAGATFFFIGGRPGVAEKARDNLIKEFPGLKIIGCMHGYFDNVQDREVVNMINEARPDILLVAIGVPKQEKWIFHNKDKIEAKIFTGVGGFFDFAARINMRAPKWMRKIGMEWIFRLIQEPKRLRQRYILGNIEFLYYTLKDFLKKI